MDTPEEATAVLTDIVNGITIILAGYHHYQPPALTTGSILSGLLSFIKLPTWVSTQEDCVYSVESASKEDRQRWGGGSF